MWIIDFLKIVEVFVFFFKNNVRVLYIVSGRIMEFFRVSSLGG